MSDDENRGYGRRRSAPVPVASVSPMEEVDRKREPKPSYGSSYKIPKKPRDAGGSSGYSRERNSSRNDVRSHDRSRDRDYKRKDSFEDSRSPLSRRDSRDSKSSRGFNKRYGGHLEEELSVAENDTSWKDLIDDNAPPPDLSWKSVDRDGESGLPDFSKKYKKGLPSEEEKKERQENPPINNPPVKVDYSITNVIRILKMSDKQPDRDDRDIKREKRRDSDEVILVERHIDEDLKDHVDPNPDDIEFQDARLREGELTKEEKKRWKRRYKGEAVFMLPTRKAEELKRNYQSRPPRGGGRDRRSDPLHDSLRMQHPNPNTMEIKPRIGRGFGSERSSGGFGSRRSEKSREGGDTINRLQQLAGTGRSPTIKEEHYRSRSPNETRRSGQSGSRRSRSRDRNERRRSRDRSPLMPPARKPSSPPPQCSPQPSRSQYQSSRSRSRSPHMQERNVSDRYIHGSNRSGYDRPKSPVGPRSPPIESSFEIKQEPMRLERMPEITSRRLPGSTSPSPPTRHSVPYSSRDRNRDHQSLRSRPRSPSPLPYHDHRRERPKSPRSPERYRYSDSKSDRYRRDRR